MTSEASALPVNGTPPASASKPKSSPVRAVWEKWKKLAHAIGIVQTRLLLVLFYFAFVFPLGLAMRLGGDRLHLKLESRSHWSPHPQEEQSLERARQQF